MIMQEENVSDAVTVTESMSGTYCDSVSRPDVAETSSSTTH
jgi:hypothetical protein